MSGWTLGDIAACLGAPIRAFSPEAPVSGVSTDSRTLEEGSLFVPLVGENFDGHNFAQAAVQQRGARAVVWSRPELPSWLDPEQITVFPVDDTLHAYQSLGLFWKVKCEVRCLAVTGSVGKTTTKEFIAHLLEPHFHLHKSQANFNNDIGVPKTLLELTPEHEIVVVEMGMRGLGEISRLVHAARPEIGVITAIGTSHLELLGSRENIAKAKGELVAGLPPDGVAVLPATDDFFPLLRELSAAPISAYAAVAHVRESLCPQAILQEDQAGTTFLLEGKEYRLELPGRHHLHDLFAALAAGQALGIGLPDLLGALASLSNPAGRAEWIEARGARIYLDAYNSAPESLRASLQVLSSCSGRKLAVLGDMLELGEDGPRVHRDLGASLADYGVNLALCYGPLSREMVTGATQRGVYAEWFSDKALLAKRLEFELQAGDSVLIKASRGMALETVLEALEERIG